MFAVRWIAIIFISLGTSAFAEDCDLTNSGLQMASRAMCHAEMEANNCNQYFYEHDVSYFSRRTCEERPPFLSAAAVVANCASGGIEATLDIAKDIAQSIAAIWDTAVANAEERSALMGFCDKNLQCKRVLVQGVPTLESLSDADITRMSTNDLIQRVNAYRESEARTSTYMRALMGTRPPDDEEEVTNLNPEVDEAKAQILVEAAKAWLANQGVALACTSAAGKSEMLCYGIFSVVSPAGALGWAAKVKKLAGFNMAIAELRMGRLASIGVKEGTEAADIRFLNRTDTQFETFVDEGGYSDKRQNFLKITKAGKPLAQGAAGTNWLLHPDFQRELDRMTELGVEVTIDPKMNPLGMTAGYYAPWAKRISLPSSGAWTTFKHEAQHAEFDHFLESHFAAASVQVRQGRSIAEVLPPGALQRYSPREIQTMESLMKNGTDSISVNERLSSMRELEIMGWHSMSWKAMEARAYGRSFMVKYLRGVVSSGQATAAEKAALLKESMLVYGQYGAGTMGALGGYVKQVGGYGLIGATGYETAYQLMYSDNGDVIVYNPESKIATLVQPAP